MAFHGILFDKKHMKKETLEAPDCFPDLNLDQIIDAITAGRAEYNLKPFFYTPLSDIESITYRQEIMRDLENQTLFENVRLFAQRMRSMRVDLALVDRLQYKYNQEGWFLEAVDTYCDAVRCLARDLSLADRDRGVSWPSRST